MMTTEKTDQATETTPKSDSNKSQWVKPELIALHDESVDGKIAAPSEFSPPFGPS